MNWLQKISSEVKDSPLCFITVGGVDLHGMLFSAPESTTACLFIPGTGGNFYGDAWVFNVAETLVELGISFLTANNRGSTSLSSYPPHGATLEKFSNCVDDINGWLHFLKAEGFNRFILAGHSFGTEKIVHYMSQNNKEIVESIILLGFADSFGTTKNYLGDRFDKSMNEAKSLLKQGKGEEFLTTDWLSHGGILPTSARTFVDLFADNSALSKALPLRGNKLESYSKIDVPILAIIGDEEEYTASSIEHAISLMRSQNTNSTVEQIRDCDHDFTGQEEKLCSIIETFIQEYS